MEQKEYFEKNIEKLNIQREARQNILRLKTRELISPYCSGKVLDVGYGGRIDYVTDKAEELHLLDIFSPVKETVPGNIRYYRGDILSLSLPENYFDNIFMLYLLHHLARDSFRETKDYFRRVLERCGRLLKTGGRLVILEGLVIPPVFYLECSLYKLLKKTAGFFSKPMIFYFSPGFLEKQFHSCGFKIVRREKINMEGFSISPYNYNVFIPYRFAGLGIYLLEITKS